MKKILSLLLIQVLLLCGCASRLADPTTTATAAPAPSDAASLETTLMPDTTAPEEETRPAAPDFTVYDQAGNSYRLSDFQGMPVVLNFWASWCGPCKNEMPAFQKAFEIYGQDVHFLIVNLTDGQIETVETAYSQLLAEGFISSREKVGYFVEQIRHSAVALAPAAAEELFCPLVPPRLWVLPKPQCHPRL